MSDDWIDVRSVPTCKEARGPIDEREEIETREGTVVAEPGDYVMRESDGSVYPIAGEKFERYYERLDDETEALPRQRGIGYWAIYLSTLMMLFAALEPDPHVLTRLAMAIPAILVAEYMWWRV